MEFVMSFTIVLSSTFDSLTPSPLDSDRKATHRRVGRPIAGTSFENAQMY